MSDLTTIKEIYLLKNLIRYNNKFRIKDESVIEHTAVVALNVLLLRQKYNFNLERALTMALIHDVPEVYISDVTHDVKEKFPELKSLLKEKELLIMKEKFPQYFNEFLDFENQESIEALIVLLADIQSVMIYAETEVTLGNTGYMKEVLETSTKLQERLLCQINQHLL